MNKSIIAGVLMVFIFCIKTWAQDSPDTLGRNIYRESAAKVNDLVHTKLEVKFDYDKSYMYGKAWITLKPHFYQTDSLVLDAKGMAINKLIIVDKSSKKELKYVYDGMLLNIKLNKTYNRTEEYTIYIDYTSKPNELKVKGSAAINDAKGLYFINPKGEDKNAPTQIWTQGETEANSAWFPTIDKPDQKSTEEIYMTVPEKYVTLSNGKLMSQKKNFDGTRTDYWNMDQPHAPYLFFMAVGDYAIVKDAYKGKEVSYYVEREYASVARKIFGNTPEMIAFYSKITGIDYPWVKYSQIVGREYVSGAMENTTATLHQESAQQDARELVDENKWENTIAHELFHQWFGDLVTAESWSNLTLNESFANYSETLWNEYKYGKDAGDEQNYKDMKGYLDSKSGSKALVRFRYADKEDMFDAVSYNKGGRILHMLRNYLGDSAFFKGLNVYLTTNKYKSAEAHQLRLAFEEVSGRDLNWFFNQWYFGSGQPSLDINYVYDDNAKKVNVIIKQIQEGNPVFKLPLAIDIYNGPNKIRYNVWLSDREQTFTFSYQSKPDLVNVDGDKILLCDKKDNKTLDSYIHQYKFAGNYLDRREAIDACAKMQDDPKAFDLLKLATRDKYYGLRDYTLDIIDFKKPQVKEAMEPLIFEIAKNEKKQTVRAKAIALLGSYINKPEYKSLFAKALNDSSYSVSGAALEAITISDNAASLEEVNKLKSKPAKGRLGQTITHILIEKGDEGDFIMIARNFGSLSFGDAKFEALQPFAQYLGKITNTDNFKKGVDLIVSFRDDIPLNYRSQTTPFINNVVLGSIITQKTAAMKGIDTSIQEQLDYVKGKIAAAKSF